MSALIENLAEPKPCELTKDEIEGIAEKLFYELGLAPGADLSPVVARFGGEIRFQDSEEWLSDESGSIFVYGPRNFTIYLSRFTSSLRDRFTIAHELGHYLLHSNSGKRPIKVKRHGSGRVEWEANWFAAGFLMPKSLFTETFREANGRLLDLASRFVVSVDAVKVRADALGLK